MSDFRLFMWMLFVVTILAIGLCGFGGVAIQQIGGGIIFGTGLIAFIAMAFKGLS